MTIDEFRKNFDEERKKMFTQAWYVLMGGLAGQTTREQIEVAKYIINRKEGMPAQKVIGDEDNPLFVIQKLNDNEIDARIKDIENRLASFERGEGEEEREGESRKEPKVSGGGNSPLPKAGGNT